MLTVDQLAEMTSGAYSYDRYTKSGWRQCIRELRNRGCNDRQIIAFLLSKHMRWAADWDEGNRSYGSHNSSTLRAYLDAGMKKSLLEECNECDFKEIDLILNGTKWSWL